MRKNYFLLLALLMAIMVLVPKQAVSQDVLEDVKSKMPELLGANNVGKEFWISIPPCFEDESSGYANFIKIFVTSPVKTLINVEVPGKGFFKTRMTVPNDVVEFNITPVQGTPWQKTGGQVTPPDNVYKGFGIHLWAEQPFVVYCVVRYRATSDGFLAFPVSSLGREYIVAAAKVDAMFGAIWNYKFPATVCMTAAYDDTKVRFALGGNVLTKTTGGMQPGQTKEWSLMKGDVLVVSTEVNEGELSGSKVTSTRPISVVSGMYCSNIPTGNQWCDYTVEMDIPTYTWGNDCHVGKIPGRKFAEEIKIFAKEPNTKIFRNGLNIGTLQQAGGVEGKAFFYMRATPDRLPGSVVISGDKPITVSVFNCGVQEDGYPLPNSDPFVMGMTPVQQYQKEITFCTPGIMGGQNFPENYINLVYETDERGMMPDHIEFAGPVHGGDFTWARCNTKFAGVDELFPYNVKGKQYALKTITLPSDGVYKIRSQTPFAAYSFGYSYCDSYGFPTSAALVDLEKPDTVAPVPTWTLPCTGEVKDGVVTDMPEDAKIRSNLSMIVFQSDFSFNYEFKYEDFVPGETRTTHWTLKVVDPSQDARAIITFTDRRGNDTTIKIEYFATKLTIHPQFADFGTMKKGEKKLLNFWVVNESDQSSATVNELKLKSGAEGFKLVLGSITFPMVIKKLDSVAFQVEFTADNEGIFRDSIGVGDPCIFFYKSLVQAKVGNPIIFVGDAFFPKITVNTTSQLDVQVRNEGTVPLTITGYTGPSQTVYTTNLPVLDNNNPWVLAPNESKVFTVTFKPTSVGSFPDKITFINDAGTDRKNVCNITGESMMPGLKANGYDWHERRINKSYAPDNGDRVIVLSNDGNQDIRVTGVTIVKDTKGSAFKFDRAGMFGGFTVPAQDSVYFAVTFDPTAQGLHELVLDYTNDFGIPTQTRLAGVGLLPRLQTYDYNFDTTTIQVLAERKTRRIVFKNLVYTTDTLSSDVATITNFTEAAAADISLDGTTYGPNAWTYNKSAITFPIVLQPGDSVEFDAHFVAQVPGPITATLTSVSDAENEVVSHWNGYGVSQLIRATGGSATSCVGSQAIINCSIENYGTTDLDVTSLEIDPLLGYVYFMNTNDAQGFKLASKATKTIQIGFTPTKAGTDNVNLVINSNAQGMEKITAPIIVTGVDYTRAAKLHTTVTPDRDRDGMPTPGEDNINISVTFDGTSDLTMAAVDSVYMQINYNGGLIKYVDGSAAIGAMAPNWTIAKVTEDSKAGNLKFVLKTNAASLNGSGEILNLKFATYLPTDKDVTNVTPMKVFAMNADQGSKCLMITPDSTTITLDQTCAYNLRSTLLFSGVNYALNAVNPNPIGTGGADISFAVGLDGYTTVAVYNTMGELVKTLVQGNVQKGAYQVPLGVEDMNSGMYWIRMISGQFSEEKQIIIAK